MSKKARKYQKANPYGDVVIQITGSAGSGKTTVAMEIARFFETMGFNVRCEDIDIKESLQAFQQNLNYHLELQPKRLDAMKARGSRILIQTHQVHKPGYVRDIMSERYDEALDEEVDA